MSARLGRVAAVVVASALPALAQDARPSADTSQQEPARAMQQVPIRENRQDQATLRERLQRRLTDASQIADRMKRAIAALDAGASAAEIAAMTEPGARRPGAWAVGEGARAAEPPPPPMDRERLMAFVRRINPEMGRRLEEALQREPAGAERLLARIERQVRDIQAEQDPELKEIKIAEARGQWRLLEATRVLAASLRRGAAEADMEAARGTVREILREQFDLRLRRQEHELARLEARVNRLRDEKQQMGGKRDEMVEGRLQQIEQNATKEPERRPLERPSEPPKP
ncbi:MAG: hypothetical protein ACKVW3_11315 [Phycisphaerales bacterium]